jgi:hypothetical protein
MHFWTPLNWNCALDLDLQPLQLLHVWSNGQRSGIHLTELVEFGSTDDDVPFSDLNLTAATYIYPSDTEDKSWS